MVEIYSFENFCNEVVKIILYRLKDGFKKIGINDLTAREIERGRDSRGGVLGISFNVYPYPFKDDKEKLFNISFHQFLPQKFKHLVTSIFGRLQKERIGGYYEERTVVCSVYAWDEQGRIVDLGFENMPLNSYMKDARKSIEKLAEKDREKHNIDIIIESSIHEIFQHEIYILVERIRAYFGAYSVDFQERISGFERAIEDVKRDLTEINSRFNALNKSRGKSKLEQLRNENQRKLEQLRDECDKKVEWVRKKLSEQRTNVFRLRYNWTKGFTGKIESNITAIENAYGEIRDLCFYMLRNPDKEIKSNPLAKGFGAIRDLELVIKVLRKNPKGRK